MPIDPVNPDLPPRAYRITGYESTDNSNSIWTELYAAYSLTAALARAIKITSESEEDLHHVVVNKSTMQLDRCWNVGTGA